MRALFLDRDGVINNRIVDAYVTTVEDFTLIAGVIPIIQFAHNLGWKIVVVTNQQGVGKGLMTESDLLEIHRHMQTVIWESVGFFLDDIYYCTDLANDGSNRRKPAPGMIFEAAADHGIELDHSIIIGDSISDAQAGTAAGLKSILIGQFPEQTASWVAPDHAGALEILKQVVH